MKNSNKSAIPLIGAYVPVFHLLLSLVHLPHIPYFSMDGPQQQNHGSAAIECIALTFELLCRDFMSEKLHIKRCTN